MYTSKSTKKLLIAGTIVLCGFSNVVSAQMPDTDIYLLSIDAKGPVIKAGKPVNITQRPGYDNQPAFIDNENLYYTSRRDNQTDIYTYSLKDSKSVAATQTPESEYSATPLKDGSFSVVQVEKDSTQRLHRFGAGKNNGEVIVNVDSVGYHCWIDDKTIAAFVLTKPFSLQIIDVPTASAKTIALNPGRCLKMRPGRGELCFTDQTDTANWVIKTWNPRTNEIKTLIKTLPHVEDYTWTNDGRLLCGYQGLLYSASPLQSQEWMVVADLKSGELKDFQRIAISPDNKHLAIVSK